MPDQPAIDLAINTATTRRQWSLAQAIEGYARAGITAIGPWREEIREMGPQRAARQISDAGLKVTGLCRAGLLSVLDEAQFHAALDDNRRAIDEAAALGANVVVLVAGGLPNGVVELAAVRERVAEGIAALIPDAKAAGVRLGIEPLHPVYAADRCVINTLDQALDLSDSLDPDDDNGLGVIVDTYHVWWDPGLAEAVERAAPRTLGYHINDWMSPQTDPLNDRGMMGDGAIDLVGITRLVRSAGITLTPEVELFSDRWWAEDPDVVVQTCIDRWRAITAQIIATD
jgi:sugar phosphate isomerase/epimerase